MRGCNEVEAAPLIVLCFRWMRDDCELRNFCLKMRLIGELDNVDNNENNNEKQNVAPTRC